MQEKNLITAHNDEFIGEVNGKRYYMGPESEKRMTWDEAHTWCASLGEGYELPSLAVLMMCYNNEKLRKQFQDGLYWSSDEYEFDSSGAWVQCFDIGDQCDHFKYRPFYVRAVRVE